MGSNPIQVTKKVYNSILEFFIFAKKWVQKGVNLMKKWAQKGVNLIKKVGAKRCDLWYISSRK